MKGYFYPLWKRVSVSPPIRLLPCLLVCLSLLLFLQPVDANTVVIGTGTGTLNVSSMTGLNPGDTISINPGTYSWCQFQNLNGVTIINNGGLVTFTNDLTFSNNTNVNFTGSGSPSLKYGFYASNTTSDVILTFGSFTGCTWSNMEFVNCTGSNGVINAQNNMIQYDGVNNNTKEYYLCKFTNMHLSGCGGLIGNFKGPFYNVIDSTEFSYVVVDNATGPTQINYYGMYRADIHHWKLNGITSWQNQDVGSFMINGTVKLHDNIRSGVQWGWMIRLNMQALNGNGDSYIYNNICTGGISYGFIDYRLAASTTGTPFTGGGNIYVYNNTVGNCQNQNGYATSVFLDYGHPGFIADVRNNLRFHSTNYGGIADSVSVINFGPTGNTIYSSNNMYYANPITSGVLVDTVNFYEQAGSPTIDAGMTIPWVKDDFGGISRPQGAAYDVGAREYNQNSPPPVNKAPVAITGPSQTITLPTNTVTLDGSKSMDSDGSISAYLWAQVSGPSSTISSPSSAKTPVTGMTQGTYIFKLTVTDNQGATGSAYDTVIVKPAVNQPPVAIASAKQTITLPTNTATLDGSKSYDPDGTISAYAWSEISGPAATIGTPTAATTGISGLTQGTYIFQLTVTDNSGAIGSAFDTVLVNPAPNQPPVAIAGAKQTITLPANTATLDGSKSYDPDGSIATYAWSQLSGPAGTIASPSSATTSANGLVQGNYIFKLTVTDNQGATAVAYDTIVVRPAVSNTPVADAGFNQTITLPTNSATLNGSGSYDSSGTITTYSWTQVSGPSTAGISTPAGVSTSVTGLQQGSYVFQLTVTDNSGATATNQVTITVNPAPNQPPVANAGSNQTITLPATATLNGTKSSDPDGSIAAYSWVEVSGPGAAVITSGNTATPVISGLQAGTYVFQLTVTDNKGATSSAQVTITVIAANQPPVANAGTDQTIQLPTNSVNLDGSKSYDPDGSITAYSWVKVSGPGAVTITNSNTAKPTALGLQQGVYVFQLTVTDNQGATGSDQVTVTVNAAANQAPIANAGTNLTVTLPTNTVNLDGTKSYDPDGSIVAYTWSQTSGPSTAAVTNANTATPAVSGLLAGAYVFRLTVTDNQGASGTATVTVTVVNPGQASQPPVADAGNDTTIALPANSVTLDGSGSTDQSGAITSYQWTEMSGPNTAIFSGTTEAVSTASSLVVGEYVFQLTVTNSQGLSSTATVKVDVVNTLKSTQSTLLYPNPAHDVVNLRVIGDSTGMVKVNIFDMSGKLVQMLQMDKETSYIDNPINIANLASGVYAVQVIIGNQKMVTKLMKQ